MPSSITPAGDNPGSPIGTILMALGTVVVILGAILRYAPWLIGWFGRLPGDIHIERENSSVFIPITSMLVASAVVSLALNVIFRR